MAPLTWSGILRGNRSQEIIKVFLEEMMHELSFEGCKGIDKKDGDCGRKQGGRGGTHSGSIRGKCSWSDHIELQCTTLRQ